MQPQTSHLRLLQPSTLDRLPIIGEGFTGRVYRYRNCAVKVAHPTPHCLHQMSLEIELLQRLQDPIFNISVPKLYAVREDCTAFVREFVTGLSLFEILLEHDGVLPDSYMELLLPLYHAVESFRHETKTVLDFTPVNLFLEKESQQFLLCDTGVRLAPYRFPDLSPEELRQALTTYLPWRMELESRSKVQRFDLPPSGRFHLEVPVGPIKEGRVLWSNTSALLEHNLSLSSRELRRLAGVATHASNLTTTLPSMYYQDSPGKGEGHAKGDGRAVYLGQVKGGSYGRRELMLKGCGPTPLAWTGNEFHEDGFVSFQRSLWEASVCDELARLGFDTPEVLALVDTGKTTIDNTLIEWPAAAAVRMADTHFRVGHISYWTDDPDALYALCLHIGKLVVRDDFNPSKYTHLRQWLNLFSDNLGFDVGKTDALNIHCFNPTMGNVRVDGHFVDFSTVRFHRYYVPHFKYMNNTRRIREHRVGYRRYPSRLVNMWVAGGLLTEDQGRRLMKSATRRYDERFVDGYIEGFCMFLGLTPDELAYSRRQQLRNFVLDTQHLRKLRAEETLRFEFWKQTCPAPLFDVEGLLPDFVRAWRAGERQSWKKLRSNFAGRLKSYDGCIVRSWYQSLRRLVPLDTLNKLQPKRWDEVIRPFMEPETLAEICYHQSTPQSFGLWKQAISSRRQLPLGSYSYEEARCLALKNHHLVCRSLVPDVAEVVVGMTQELSEHLAQILDDFFEESLVGVLACGPRVMTGSQWKQLQDDSPDKVPWSQKLVEDGQQSRRTTPLFLKIVVDDSHSVYEKSIERTILQKLNELYCGFRFAKLPTQSLVDATEAASLRSYCKLLVNGSQERESITRWEGWVQLYDPEGREKGLERLLP